MDRLTVILNAALAAFKAVSGWLIGKRDGAPVLNQVQRAADVIGGFMASIFGPTWKVLGSFDRYTVLVILFGFPASLILMSVAGMIFFGFILLPLRGGAGPEYQSYCFALSALIIFCSFVTVWIKIQADAKAPK